LGETELEKNLKYDWSLILEQVIGVNTSDIVTLFVL
jgi:hypothetical protein